MKSFISKFIFFLIYDIYIYICLVDLCQISQIQIVNQIQDLIPHLQLNDMCIQRNQLPNKYIFQHPPNIVIRALQLTCMDVFVLPTLLAGQVIWLSYTRQSLSLLLQHENSLLCHANCWRGLCSPLFELCSTATTAGAVQHSY